MNARDHHPKGPEFARASCSRRLRLIPLAVLSLGVASMIVLLPPIPQDPAYHRFADRRPILGLPNALNVLSNLPFLAVGVAGLVSLVGTRRGLPSLRFETGYEALPFALFFGGVLLTAIGSGYYHWTPDSQTLVWDRLPMTVGFMSLLAISISERISTRLGQLLALPLIAGGLASVSYWHASGNLKYYLLVQYGTLATVFMILLLFPPRYTRTSDLWAALGCYALAKLFECLDAPIYTLGTIVSGHTLKHLAAAVSAALILRMMDLRESLAHRVLVRSIPLAFDREGH
jgi:hypothetical protein